MASAVSRETEASMVSAVALRPAPMIPLAIWTRMARSSLMISRCMGPMSPSASAGIGMSLFLTLHSSSFTQMRFNIRFTPVTGSQRAARRSTPTVNHAAAPFIENKRYPAKPRRVGDVVNRKAASVYQTDANLILAGGVQGRSKRALPKKQFQTVSTRRNSTEYVDVQKNVSCAPRECVLPRTPSGQGDRSRGRPRAQRDLCRAARAAACPGAHGLCRALQYGRRLHRIPVRRRARPGRALPAATRLSAAAVISGAGPDADGAAAGDAPGGGYCLLYTSDAADDL